MDNLKWYEKNGPLADVVLSTRVRLARNLKQYPFPVRADSVQKAEIEEKVKDALLSGNSILADEFRFVSLNDLNDTECVSLVERHMVSPEFISDRRNKAVLVSQDEGIAIMINEEDHLRIQVMHSGLSLKECAETADRLDSLLSETLDFAFDSQLGYLTQCPTNLGIGMRASVMLHLPALTETGAMSRIAANLSKLGMTLRGSYGEGSKVIGSMYQLSNQITLGLSEGEALSNLSTISGQLIEQEKKARRELAETIAVQDKIQRAVGICKSARLLSTEECMEQLSGIRFGLSAGLITGVSFEELYGLSVKVQPCTLADGKLLEQTQRDMLRADRVRAVCMKIKE